MRRFSVDGLALVCGMLAAIGSEASQLVPEVPAWTGSGGTGDTRAKVRADSRHLPSDLRQELAGGRSVVLSGVWILTNPQAPQRLVVDVVCTASPAIRFSCSTGHGQIGRGRRPPDCDQSLARRCLM